MPGGEAWPMRPHHMCAALLVAHSTAAFAPTHGAVRGGAASAFFKFDSGTKKYVENGKSDKFN